MIRAIVLAAGKGTRMKSSRPKVLHVLCGRPMLWWTLQALAGVAVDETIVVVNRELESEATELIANSGLHSTSIVVQEPQRGTGHAVQVALSASAPADATVIIVSADMPLIEASLMQRTIDARTGALALVTARMPLPSNFGRIVRENGTVARIVEARDAGPGELGIEEMNAGLYAFDEPKLRAALRELSDDNAQGEYYLTDTVAAFVRRGERPVPVVADDYHSVLGVNDRAELAAAGGRLNALLCERHMRAGVTIVDPATTYLEPELEIAADVTILPNTTIARKSSIGSGSEIGPNVRLADARIGREVVIADSIVVSSQIGDFCHIGPYAHLRGESVLDTAVRIGNFVETKNAKLGAGVRASHLSYLGDVTVGKRSNIGAGTITCNFDGVQKHETHIGDDVFVGSNSSLIAPLTLADGAATGAGAVVTRDVAAGERVAGNPARPLPAKSLEAPALLRQDSRGESP